MQLYQFSKSQYYNVCVAVIIPSSLSLDEKCCISDPMNVMSMGAWQPYKNLTPLEIEMIENVEESN